MEENVTKLSKEDVQQYILENCEKETTEQMAISLDVPRNIIGGNIVALMKKLKIKKNETTNQYEVVKRVKSLYIGEHFSKKRHNLGEFTNKNGKNKNIGRDKVVNFILSAKVSEKPILTLSGVNCITEKLLLEQNNKLNFISAENKFYNDLAKTIYEDKLPISIFNGDISYLINNANENQFSHAILDYCSQLSSIDEDIEMVFKKNIVEVGGFIAITFNKRYGSSTNKIQKTLESVYPYRNTKISRSEHYINTLIVGVGNFNYHIVETYQYKDTSAMSLIIVKRVL